MTIDAARAGTLEGLALLADELKSAMTELYGEPEPADPAALVRRIRAARQGIRFLLTEAERLKMQDPLVLRLRAAHLPWPPK